ncbi:MAG: S8 family serine peptidase [Bacteroidia bacterium]
MKGSGLFAFLLFLLPIASAQEFSPDRTKVDDVVLERMAKSPSSFIRIYVYLYDQVDLEELNHNFEKLDSPPETRGRETILALKQKAASAQPELMSWLKVFPENQVTHIRSFWIANMVSLSARPSAISAISHHLDVAWIGLDAAVEPDEAHSESAVASMPMPGGHEQGLSAINAPVLWAMGYTGYGRSVLSIDTGVDHTHPALAQRFRGMYVPFDQAWFSDSVQSTEPFVCINAFGVRQDHGTHVTGIMVGYDPATADTIGVAPEGLWMGAPAICDLYSSDNIAALQWALDPDGDPLTVNDMPDVINNSWRTVDVGDACKHLAYRQSLLALETAGIAVVFSAGNEGPSAGSVAPPKGLNTGLVNTFAVGAVNGSVPEFPIQGFSGRGPSPCPGTGSLQIKPEVVAPGVSVRSTVLNGKYGTKSGTSMSAPHASGALLLLKEAFPYLTGEALKLALYYTAADLGLPGEDNAYGMGMIDVAAAFDYLVAQGNVPVVPSRENDVAVVSVENMNSLYCEGSVSPVIRWKNQGSDTLFSVELEYRYSDGTAGLLLITDTVFQDSIFFSPLPAHTFSPGVYTLEVELKSPNGENDYRFLDNRRVLTFAIAPPLPQVSGDTVCEFSEGMFTAVSAVPGTVIRWYSDSLGGSLIGEGNSWITPTLSAGYQLYAAAEWPGETGSQCARVPAKAVVVPGEMTAIFTVGGQKLVWPDSSEAEFSNQSVGSVAWRWEFGDGAFSSIQNPYHTYGSAGTFRVNFSAQSISGCADAYSDTVVVGQQAITTGLDNRSAFSVRPFTLFPNPASDKISIRSNSGGEQILSIEMLDMRGRILFREMIDKGEKTDREIMLERYPLGVYILLIRTNKHAFSEKIIISP